MMAEKSKPGYWEFLRQLARGAEKTFQNAEALFSEAKILSSAGALGRALFLHQISLEECAKIENIGAWAVSVLAGLSVDEKKVLASLTRHSSKNRLNAYMLEGSAAETAAKKRGDWKTALTEFKKLQTEFHANSNAAKNASLYVDFENGTFVAPFDRISPQMVAEIADRNETFLGLTFPKVKMLLRWERSPENAQEAVVAFVELAEAMKAEEPENLIAAFNNLIGKFLELELGRRAVKRRTGEAGC
jgi:AbiV family abortive infection protein